MNTRINKRLQEMDQHIIGLYNIVGSNSDTSIPEIERHLNKLKNLNGFKSSREYKFQCCDK
jgi:hypothetical protein